MTKQYHERYGVGSTKYSVYFHNGIDTHKDGSEFFDMRVFRNKKKKEAFTKQLRADGYKPS